MQLAKKHEAEVKMYKRKNSTQYIITLRQGHPFNEGEKVIITTLDSLLVVDDKIKELQDKYEQALNNNDKLRSNNSHLQERLTRSLENIIELEKEITQYKVIISKIESMSWLDRLRNKLPNEIKLLTD